MHLLSDAIWLPYFYFEAFLWTLGILSQSFSQNPERKLKKFLLSTLRATGKVVINRTMAY